MLKVFIGCLPGDCDRQELTALIEQYAAIKKLALVTNKNASGQTYCKGYGFAICHSLTDLEALAALDGRIYYRDRPLNFRKYKTGSSLTEEREAFNRRRVFVGNIPVHLHEYQVADLLTRFGAIKKVYFIANASDKRLKFGYAVFHHEATVQRILSTNPRIKTCGVTLRIESFGGKKSPEEQPEEMPALQEKQSPEETQKDAFHLARPREEASMASSGRLLAFKKEGSTRPALSPLRKATVVKSLETDSQSQQFTIKFDKSLCVTKVKVQQNHEPSNIRLNLSMPAFDRVKPRISKAKADE